MKDEDLIHIATQYSNLYSLCDEAMKIKRDVGFQFYVNVSKLRFDGFFVSNSSKFDSQIPTLVKGLSIEEVFSDPEDSLGIRSKSRNRIELKGKRSLKKNQKLVKVSKKIINLIKISQLNRIQTKKRSLIGKISALTNKFTTARNSKNTAPSG
jgi:hypothetical protein